MLNSKIPLATQVWLWITFQSIETKLIDACIEGNIEEVIKFLEYGAKNIDEAVLTAIELSNIEIVKLLLSHQQSNVNTRIGGINVALASTNPDSNEILDELIKDPALEHSLKFEVALHEKFFFTSLNSKRYQFVKQVIADCATNQELTAEDLNDEFHSLVCLDEYFDVNNEYLDFETDDRHIVNSQVEKARLLVQNPLIDLNAQDDEGYTTLMYIRMGNIIEYQLDMVKVLLANPRIDVNIKDHNGDTVLFQAAERGDHEMVALLLAHPNIKINIQNNEGVTPLMAAWYDEDSVKLLRAHKDINLNLKDHSGKSFFDYQKGL